MINTASANYARLFQAVNDNRLSLSSKGYYAYLSTRPESSLFTDINADTLFAFHELSKYGYLTAIRPANEKDAELVYRLADIDIKETYLFLYGEDLEEDNSPI